MSQVEPSWAKLSQVEPSSQLCFLHDFFMAKNWCRQIHIMTSLDHIDKKWQFMNDRFLRVDSFFNLHFCSYLSTSIRIFALKKIFLTSSKHFIETNFKKHFFKLATNLIYTNMKYLDELRHSQFSKKISWAF